MCNIVIKMSRFLFYFFLNAKLVSSVAYISMIGTKKMHTKINTIMDGNMWLKCNNEWAIKTMAEWSKCEVVVVKPSQNMK